MKKRMCHGCGLLFITALLLAFSCARQEEDPIPGGNGRDVQFSAVSRPDADAARTRAEGIPDEEADATVWIDWDGVSWVKEREGCRQAPETRTAYSGKTYGTPKKERIDWVDGDRISIWCDQNQDSNTKMVDYAVTPSGHDNEIDKGTIKAIPPVGLCWSSETGTHWFEGVYPGETTQGDKCYVNFAEEGAQKLKFSFQIPESQPGIGRSQSADPNHDTTFINPNMAYAPMAAKASGTKNGGTVTLPFHPVFTAFQITVKNRLSGKTMTVKKIGLEYVGTGDAKLSGDASWTMGRNQYPDPATPYAVGTTTRQKIEWSNTGVELDAGTTKALRVTLFAHPTDFDALTLYVETAESGLLKLPLKQNGSFYKFLARKKYNINLGPLPGDYRITITQPEAFLYAGTSVSGKPVRDTVKSFMLNHKDNTKQAVPWKLQYSTDGTHWFDTKPTWLKTIKETGGTSLVNEPGDVQVAASSSTTITEQVLQNMDPVPGVYDLSTKGGTTKRYTANCYLVHGPGKYRFPLVYGNAITGGEPYEHSYKAAVSPGKQTFFLKNLVNYNDDPINSPEIDKNLNTAGNVVNGAALVWQDAKSLITEVKVVSEGGDELNKIPTDGSMRYIQFTVGKDITKLVQGNAMIAAMHGSTIVWSWHIWITPYELGDDKVIEQEPGKELVDESTLAPVESKVAQLPIGWCDNGTSSKVWPGRWTLVRAVQTIPGGAKSDPVTIRQHSHYQFVPAGEDQADKGNCVYFQHGRKDPFPGPEYDPVHYPNNDSRYFKKIYDINNNLLNVNSQIYNTTFQHGHLPDYGTVTIGTSIQHPTIFWNYNWTLITKRTWTTFGKQYRNLWRIDQLSETPNYSCWATRSNTDNNDYYQAKATRSYGTKTVYDPCPAGYMVPPYGMFLRGETGNPLFNCFTKFMGYNYPKTRALVYADPANIIQVFFSNNVDTGSMVQWKILTGYWASTSYGVYVNYGDSFVVRYGQRFMERNLEQFGMAALGLPVIPGKIFDLQPAKPAQ